MEGSGSSVLWLCLLAAPLLASGVPLTADTVTFGHSVKNGALKPTGAPVPFASRYPNFYTATACPYEYEYA
jgi:hypothetical protein